MALAKRYDYKLFGNSEDWTVDTLNTKLNINKEKRVPFINLVNINAKTLKELKLENNTLLPYIEVKNVDSQKKTIDVQRLEEIALKDLPKRAKYAGRPGDIILSAIRPDRGSIAILPNDYDLYAVSSNFFVLTPIDLPSELLYFILSDESILNEFGALSGGSVIPTMTLKQLKNYQIKDFDNSSKAITAAIDLYKESKVTLESSMSISEASDTVFKNELSVSNKPYKVTPKFMPLDYAALKDRFDVEFLLSVDTPSLKWKVNTSKIKDIALVENAPCKAKSNEYFSERIPLIQTKDLQEDAIYVYFKEVETIPVNYGESKNNEFLHPTDIVLAKIGGKLSKSAIVPNELKGAISNPNTYVIRNEYDDVLNEYLVLFLRTTMAKEQVESLMRPGATMKMLTLSMIKELEVPMPTLEKQKNIVEAIKKLTNSKIENKIEDNIKLFRKRLFKI